MEKNICVLITLAVFFLSCKHFDSNKPDTHSNKERFVEYLDVDLTTDVKNVYGDADFGKDYSVLMAFSCDSITIKKIIEKKKLKRSDKDDDLTFFVADDEYSWWDNEMINKIRPYKKEESRHGEFLWYDKEMRKAFYQEFSY